MKKIMLIILMLRFFPLLAFGESENQELLISFCEKGETICYAEIPFAEKKIIIFALQENITSNKITYSGEQLLLVLDKRDKILNVSRIYRNNLTNYVCIRDNILGVSFSSEPNDSNYGIQVLLYKISNNEFVIHNTGYVFFSNIFIYGDEVYYSSEKAFPNINVFDVENETRHTYDEYLPSADFFVENGEVYAVQDQVDPRHVYKITNAGLIEIARTNFNYSIEDHMYLNDFYVDTSGYSIDDFIK